ncbi:MAG: hypothetical protein QNJ11_14920 [Woeseiaceae bacterium]|nr:hypothetical protein [Woeseiaceae bacterium]
MTSRTRSMIGALMMLAILPILAGLLACMPVPIGDPERSRIDPDINGVWVMDEEGDFVLYAFQPYDKRTWLVTVAKVEAGPDLEGEPPETNSLESLLQALDTHAIGRDGITSPDTVVYKAWLAKIGGVRFMTWEQMGGFDDAGNFTPTFWFVFKVIKPNADRVEFHMINPEHDGFDHLVMPDDYEGDDYARDMRRKWERALRKVAKDEELYTDPLVMTRLPDEYLDEASELFQEVIDFSD